MPRAEFRQLDSGQARDPKSRRGGITTMGIFANEEVRRRWMKTSAILLVIGLLLMAAVLIFG